ncbi:MAG: ATP-binding cassette domain-containing protein [Bellilinea sp.]
MTISVQNLTKIYKRRLLTQGQYSILKNFLKPTYEKVQALCNISLTIGQGEMVGLIGPNGAGKSTLIKILSGILVPTSGDVRVLEHIPWAHNKTCQSQISLIIGQKTQLWWDLPALDSYELLKAVYHIAANDFDKRLARLSEMLNVTDLLNVPIRELSLGERIKTELIGGLLHNPKIIFLDEPTIGLDLSAQYQIRSFLREYNSLTNASIILTSHYVRDIESVCDRIVVLHKGQFYYDGTQDALSEKFIPYKKLMIHHQPGEYSWRLDPSVVNTSPDQASAYLPVDQVDDFIALVVSQSPIYEVVVEDETLEDLIRRIYNRLSK